MDSIKNSRENLKQTGGKDNISNALYAMEDGGIEKQEARGQTAFVKSASWPIKMDTNINTFKHMGLIFGGKIDDLFMEVQLPNGWKIEPTDHSMWSDLKDDKDRVRASIFYKAAFYDRDAFVHPTHFMSAGYECPADLDYNMDRKIRDTSPHIGYVRDSNGKEYYRTHEIIPSKEYGEKTFKVLELRDMAYEWLEENFPDHKDPLAYWDKS